MARKGKRAICIYLDEIADKPIIQYLNNSPLGKKDTIIEALSYYMIATKLNQLPPKEEVGVSDT